MHSAVLHSFALLPLALAGSTQSWVVSSTMPAGAGPPVDPSFPGFAFEVASFYNYAIDEKGRPNTFSQNLINEVLSRTGGTPILRVGGTSGDHGSFDESGNQTAPVNRPATEYPPAFNAPFLVVGQSYFKAFSSFPNANFILMVPLHSRNIANSVAWAEAALLKIKNLDALELGNEPDYYPWWSLSNYTSAYNNMRTALKSAIPRLRTSGLIFQAIDKAWEPMSPLPVSKVHAQLNASGDIKQYAYHYYQTAFKWNTNLLSSRIANHTWTVQSMARLRPNIAFLRQTNPTVPFLMDEIGANMVQTQGHNNLATSLWELDYMLHCMVIGVSRVNWQQIVIPGFNMWQPVTSKWAPPMVRANFYAMPFAADFIGKNRPRVNNVPAVESDTTAAYTAWEGGELMRIAIVNLELWKGGGIRPRQSFKISGLDKQVTGALVKKLTAPEGSLANNTLTYGGMQWTYESAGKGVSVAKKDANVEIKAKSGTLEIDVEAGSAVLVTLKRGDKVTSKGLRRRNLW